jgi:cytochrome c-type biogenesis protein
VGLGIRYLVGALDFFKRNYHWITGVAGGVMVAIGFLIFTGLWDQVIAPIRTMISGFQPPI